MRSLILLPAFIYATSSFAQNTAQSPEQQQMTVLKPETQSANDPLAGQTIEHCEAIIKAIDVKVAHVQSDPVKSEKAVADGWFDRMAKNREVYVSRKKSLEERNATNK